MLTMGAFVEDASPFGILLAPGAVTVIDTFRALGDFEEHYDLAALDQLEKALAREVGPPAAKALVSDALLLAFGLRRERRAPLAFQPIGSRRATLDEYGLLSLLAAVHREDDALATLAASALNLSDWRPLGALACDIAERFDAVGIPPIGPNPVLLGGEADAVTVVEVERRNSAPVRRFF